MHENPVHITDANDSQRCRDVAKHQSKLLNRVVPLLHAIAN